MLADVLVLRGRFEKARSYYAEAIQIRYGLAVALHRLERIDEAVQHYTEALCLQPNHAEIHNNLGTALGQRGKLVEALRHFEKAVRLQLGYTDTKRNFT